VPSRELALELLEDSKGRCNPQRQQLIDSKDDDPLPFEVFSSKDVQVTRSLEEAKEFCKKHGL
jgi:hypothetical protein